LKRRSVAYQILQENGSTLMGSAGREACSRQSKQSESCFNLEIIAGDLKYHIGFFMQSSAQGCVRKKPKPDPDRSAIRCPPMLPSREDAAGRAQAYNGRLFLQVAPAGPAATLA
jgi:hypothetical protein